MKKILSIIVLYEQQLEDSLSYQSFQALSRHMDEPPTLIVYDNSAVPLATIPSGIIYHHDSRNIGVQPAYEYARLHAETLHYPYILLLDQDSWITKDLWHGYLASICSVNPPTAVVPRVYDDETLVSPFYTTSLFSKKSMVVQPGLYTAGITAISSGCLLSTDFISKQGGFSEEFPLDYLDHWLFYLFEKEREPVLVLSDYLKHQLSVQDYDSISVERYHSISQAERHFYQTYRPELFPTYQRHLYKRLLKQILTVKNKRIAKMTWDLIKK